MDNTTTKEKISPTWRIKDVADYLHVSPKTVLRMVYRGALPYRRVGPRLIRFVPGEIQRAFEGDELREE